MRTFICRSSRKLSRPGHFPSSEASATITCGSQHASRGGKFPSSFLANRLDVSQVCKGQKFLDTVGFQSNSAWLHTRPKRNCTVPSPGLMLQWNGSHHQSPYCSGKPGSSWPKRMTLAGHASAPSKHDLECNTICISTANDSSQIRRLGLAIFLVLATLQAALVSS